MNKENTKKLVNDFPELYKQFYNNEKQTCMCWGFECGDGWFDLIYNLSKKLSKIDGLETVQVKEKFGTLRFYTNLYFEEADEEIIKAEELSGKTCDVCGKEGNLIGQGWLRTRCDEHK